MDLIPLFMDVPGKGAISVLLLLMTFRGILSAVCNTAWNGWIRDLIPQTILRQFFSRRLALATVMGMVFSLGAAFFSTRQLNLTLSWMSPESFLELPALSIIGYDFLFAIAFVFGLTTLSMLAAISEEGEVTREVILESMVYPARDVSLPPSAVPQYNLISTATFGNLKRIPIPGFDAVLGVTAY